MNITWLFSFLTDSIIALLYFRQDTSTPVRKRCWLKPILLLALLPLYPNSIMSAIPPAMRVTYRVIVYFALLRYAECVSGRMSAYGALFWTSVYVLFQNVFFGPYFHDIFMGYSPILRSLLWSQILLSCVTVASRLAYFGIIASLFRFADMERARLTHIGFAAGICGIDIFTQHTGMLLISTFKDIPGQFSVYYILLHAALLLFLLAFEYARRQSAEVAVMIRQSATSEALLENIRSRQHSEESIRSLRHDLKNHATTIQLLIEQGDMDRAMKYLDTLREEAAAPAGTFHTGNDLLNGILRQKLSPAMNQGINVDVSLNFHQGEFIEPFDLCVLMGNALDNAVEACLKIDPQDRRFIRVTGGPSANCLLIRVENSCVTEISASGNMPHTTKADTVLHGYGLRNMRRVLKRYGGNLTITTEKVGRFTSTILIPTP